MAVSDHPEVEQHLATALPGKPVAGHNLATSIDASVWLQLAATLGPLIVSIVKAIFAAFPAPTPAPAAAPAPTTPPTP